MTEQAFLVELQDMLQCEEPLHIQTILPNLEEWDSLAFMVVIAFFDKNFKQQLTFPRLKACQTVNELVGLANGAIC